MFENDELSGDRFDGHRAEALRPGRRWDMNLLQSRVNTLRISSRTKAQPNVAQALLGIGRTSSTVSDMKPRARGEYAEAQCNHAQRPWPRLLFDWTVEC
jgi:hypothetical protein